MKPYSTLEVQGVENHNITENDDSYKEAIDHPISLYPIPIENERSAVYDPQPIYYSNEKSLPAVNDAAAVNKTSRICGLSRRRLYLVLAISVLTVVGAIAGGLAGGLSSRQHNAPDNQVITDHPNTPNNSPEVNVNILSISRLASSNRTDSNGFIHRTVFFQDTHNAIVARRWDSQNETWTTSNLTQTMLRSATPLDALPGTPLASASYNWNNANEVHFWFLTPDNYINSMYLAAPDRNPNDWQPDSFGGNRLQTWPGSQLAAMYQRCTGLGCTGNWLVAYQSPIGDINVANSSHLDSPTRAIEANAVAANSSLSLGPKRDEDSGVHLASLLSEAIGSGSTSDMQKTRYFSGTWEPDGFRITDIPLPSPRLQFALTLMHNLTQVMQLALLPNGTVTAMWWADHMYHPVPSVEFRGGPVGNFSAIATDEDAMLYAIAGDEILEYEPYNADVEPLSVSFSGSYVFRQRVYP